MNEVAARSSGSQETFATTRNTANFNRKKMFLKLNTKYLYPLVTTFFWGSLYVVSKYAYAQVPPLTVLFLRYLVALIPLGLMTFKSGYVKVKKGHWKYFVFSGAFAYCLSIGMQMMATSLMNASIASLINSMNPVFISFLAVLFLHEKMTPQRIVGILCSILGVGVVVGVGGSTISIAGVLLSLGSVLLWSAYSVIIKKISASYSSAQMAFLSVVFALPFCLIGQMREMHSSPAVFTPASVLAILYIGICCTCISNLTWNTSLKKLDASICSLFYPLQPVFSAILGILILHETLTMNFVLGTLLISAGILVGLAGGKKITKTTVSDGQAAHMDSVLQPGAHGNSEV